MANPVSHDQNFKNLILDYPREALALFATDEAPSPDDEVEITPLRQEQLKERLGDRFRELDVPLLVEWTDGRRDAILFMLEEETQARKFSPLRLLGYCADLAELCATDRIVPRGDLPGRRRVGPDLAKEGLNNPVFDGRD